MFLQYPYGNHIGEQFGHLLAVAAIETDPNTGDPVVYDCKCMKCGKEHVRVLDRDLLSHKVRSCGCSNPHDLVGMKFGRWTVLKRHPLHDKFNKICWVCKCTCGTERVLSGNSLTEGHTKSCGCLRKENVSLVVLKDMIGKKFGRLTVIRRVENGKPMPTCPSGVVKYECRCDCGNTTIVSGASLRSGMTKSCGCLHREVASMNNFKDLVGKTFGRLTVLKRTTSSDYSSRWICKCACGNTCIVTTGGLMQGHTRSCGCLKRDLLSERMKIWEEDELPIIRRLHGMKSRCYNKNDERYSQYGGRGIRICDEWLDNPRTFVEWSKENGFKPELSIDRIDVNGNYCPENCRWADDVTQANNKQNSNSVNVNVVKHLIHEWADSTGKSYDELLDKLCSNYEFFTDHDKKIINEK